MTKRFLPLLGLLVVFVLYSCNSTTDTHESNNQADSELINDTTDFIAVEDDEIVTEQETSAKNLPTKEEIQSVNSKLPIQVAEGTMFTKVEYDENNMVQTFYYDFTQEVDESLISHEIINNLKRNMVNEFKKPDNKDNEERIRNGVTFLYIYRSINKKVLYKIKIDASDFD